MVAEQRNKLILNFSSLSIIQVISFLLSLIVIPHVLRKVGADGFGVIAVAQVVMFYLAAFADYGFNQTATKDITINKFDNQKISRIFFTVLVSKFILCVVGFALVLILALSVPFFNQHFQIYLFGYAFVVGQVLLTTWFFQGMEKMYYIAVISLIARLIFAILVFVFIQSKEDVSLFLLFMGLGNVIGGLIGIYGALKLFRIKFIKPTWRDILNEFKEGWQVTITNLSMISCQYIGIFILRIFTNDLVVGFYSVAERIFFGMKLMLTVYSQVIYPRVCQLVNQSRKELGLFLRQNYLPFLALVIAGSSLVFAFSPQILHFFIGYQHGQPVFLLRIMCVATVIVCMNIPSYLILLADNHKKSYLRIFTVGTLLNILSNLILAYFFHATGTVISILITELFITIALGLEIYRLYGDNKKKKKRFFKTFFSD